MAVGAPSGLGPGLDDDVVDHPSVLVRRWWPLVAVGALVGGVVGALFSATQPAIYETRVQVLVGPVVADVDALEGAADLARTYGEIVQSRKIIEAAAEGEGVDPSTVSVAASAGRGSATLSIRVRTPEQAATSRVAKGVVEALRATVSDPDSPEPAPGTGEVPLADPSLTVIDDGGGRAENQALGMELSVPLGALAGIVLAAAAAMALEARRDTSAWSHVITEHFGRDLGILESPPVVPAFVTRRYGHVISSDERPVHRARLVTGLVRGQAEPTAGHRDDQVVIFVGAPSSDRLHVQAVLQLVAAFEPPPALLDPGQLVSISVTPRDRAVPLWRYNLDAGGRHIAGLAVPAAAQQREVGSADEARDLCRELAGSAETVVVFAPVNHRVSTWRHWAAAADHSVALLCPRDLDHEALRETSTLLHATGTPVLGALQVRRRYFAGRVRPVSITLDATWWMPRDQADAVAARSEAFR